ncbi:hypothetical protein JW960_28250 [candidate division KSB1 bacterium]|nr:hypothetical protein [candidate division KSB1 bacterium]
MKKKKARKVNRINPRDDLLKNVIGIVIMLAAITIIVLVLYVQALQQQPTEIEGEKVGVITKKMLHTPESKSHAAVEAAYVSFWDGSSVYAILPQLNNMQVNNEVIVRIYRQKYGGFHYRVLREAE